MRCYVTWTRTSFVSTELMRIEKREKSTPLGRIVASARRIATVKQPKMIAETFLSCFLNIHRHINSEILENVDKFFIKFDKKKDLWKNGVL